MQREECEHLVIVTRQYLLPHARCSVEDMTYEPATVIGYWTSPQPAKELALTLFCQVESKTHWRRKR
ncbi:hypothetical protein JOQ06_002761 [Pogonophryne albipinna]|uniref:Uncharacterized protein n=1 Tax=Pogonophryne albipinna TaxID=1090488 RepID=A0AAD6B6H7_9TELE|nr:hypothetical protein JOQ06_002761 [Pogonophryne albipinna]